MTDWSILPAGAATGIIAYIGGLATKPLQSLFEERRDRKKLRRALYVEVAGIMSHLAITVEELRRNQDAAKHMDIYLGKLHIRPCFEHAKTVPLILNLLPDYPGIRDFYGGLEALHTGSQIAVNEKKPLILLASPFLRTVHAIHQHKLQMLDTKLLSKCGDQWTNTFLKGIPDIANLVRLYTSLAQED